MIHAAPVSPPHRLRTPQTMHARSSRGPGGRFPTRLLLLAAALASLPVSGASGQIRWRSFASRAANPSKRRPVEVAADAVSAGERHVVLELDRVATPPIRGKLKAAGISPLAYLGNNGYFAAIDPDAIDATAIDQIGVVHSIDRVELAWKLHPMLARGEKPLWAIVPPPVGAQDSGEWVAIYAMYHSDVAMKDVVAISRGHGALIISELNTINGAVLEMPLREVQALAGDDAVMYLEPALPPLTTNNDGNRAITQADVVQAAPYGLSGAGVKVLVYDGGTAFAQHVDFQGRLTVRDASGVIDHATHVSGTIGGGGVSNPLFKGMAPGVTIESYGYEQVGGLHQGFLYTDPGDLQADYNDAINVHGAVIANNSIGTNTAANGFPCSWEGDYGATSALIDSIVAGGLGAPFRIIWANGNERGPGRCGTTYHTTAPPACAKNHITVGALNSNDDSISYFTSWGPTDDGRLKPDISAPGCQVGGDSGVTSCSASTTGYTVFCGTSMASPTVCGLCALLLQDYRAQYPERADPRNSTLKALLAHNAQDIDAPGPDYKSGYGSVRIQRTIDFLRTGHFVEDQIGQDGVFRVLVPISPADELRVTLAWDDPPAAPNVEGTIVNDLDIVALDPNGVQHFPWTLGGLADPSAPAVQTQADHVNNIEQVYVASPMPGLWTVEIRGFSVPIGPQVFSACFTPGASGDCNSNGVNDLDDIANGTSLDCNHNRLPDECESQADCNNNGTKDICDLYNGTSPDVNNNHVPDECEPDCNQNSIPDSWELSIGTSHDCNHNLVPDECDIASGFSHDCDSNGVPDSCQQDCNQNGIADGCDIASGTSGDCDHDSVPDECQSTADCNNNGVFDFCDLLAGTSRDVNGNQIPDDCESDCNRNSIPDDWDLSTGTSQDCNGNGRPDECDIASGASIDCDSDGIPDECQIDCNHNGIQDSCDLLSGASLDCDKDGIPDECGVDCNQNGVADICDIANGTSQDLNSDGYPDECTRLYVNWLAMGTNTGITWENAFTTLDDALQQASLNIGVREVWIAAGDYAPYVNGTFAVRSGLTLYGGFGGYEQSVNERSIVAFPTTLNGDMGWFYATHVVTLDHAAAGAVLDGLNIVNGYIEGDSGSGILIQGGSPVIRNCMVANNVADAGAGVSIFGGLCTFTDCLFSENYSLSGDGGAIRTLGPGSLSLTRCVFYYNGAAEYQPGLGRGGAVFNDVGSSLSVTGCNFEGNYTQNQSRVTATLGGGIANASATATISSSSFVGNESANGGGVYTSAALTIANCLFAGNRATDPFQGDGPDVVGRGGAIFGESTVSVLLKSSTLAANWARNRTAGADMRGAMHDCILWYNVVTPLEGSPPPVVNQQYRGTVTIRYCDIQGLNPASFPGSTQDDPLFVVAPDITGGYFTAGDLHLQSGSPCIDSGENSTVPAGITADLDGLPRFFDDTTTPDTGLGTPPIVDIGAYEFQPVPIPGDINCDGVLNSLDATALAAVLIGMDGDTCHRSAADMNRDGFDDGADVQIFVQAAVAGL